MRKTEKKIRKLVKYTYIHRVSKKRSTFTTCDNFYIHSSIVIIFGTNVAKKVDNQNILYFPTLPK